MRMIMYDLEPRAQVIVVFQARDDLPPPSPEKGRSYQSSLEICLKVDWSFMEGFPWSPNLECIGVHWSKLSLVSSAMGQVSLRSAQVRVRYHSISRSPSTFAACPSQHCAWLFLVQSKSKLENYFSNRLQQRRLRSWSIAFGMELIGWIEIA